MSNTRYTNTVVAALLVAIGIATAGYFIGQTMYYSKVGINTAEVKGLAERRVDADRAYWLIQYTAGFASNAGVEVGGIRSARQAGFVIRDVGESYGDTNKIEKDVRVVTTIAFYLTK